MIGSLIGFIHYKLAIMTPSLLGWDFFSPPVSVQKLDSESAVNAIVTEADRDELRQRRLDGLKRQIAAKVREAEAKPDESVN